MFPAFGDSRECKLLKNIIEKLEANDEDGFTEAVKEYDSISRLDQWFTSILLKIKKQISQDDIR
jgi:alpha-soluble NSF attachment protein